MNSYCLRNYGRKKPKILRTVPVHTYKLITKPGQTLPVTSENMFLPLWLIAVLISESHVGDGAFIKVKL